MKSLEKLIEKARHSSFNLWLLNQVLWRAIPFNSPHCFRIIKISEAGLTISIPYKRKNLNHIKGLHACALATLCEYVTGLCLTLHVSSKEYRLILKNIQMTYHYQGKTDAAATFELTKQEIENKILIPLKTSDKIFAEFAVEVYDTSKNHLCTGMINWQIKKWEKVSLKV